MTKAALAGLTRGLARDLAPRGITVNVIQPGPTATDINDNDEMRARIRPLLAIGRLGEDTEVASLVAYLARPEASFVTGSAITINGGCLAKLSYERDFNVNTSYDDIIKDFLTCFEAKDADRLASFLHPDVVFLNYGDPEVRGKNAVRETWNRLFSNFGALRFETVHQAVNGNVVIAEQIHNIALPFGKLTPIMNMAIYEIVDGKIAAWRDYTDSAHAKKLLGL